jgi:hypothetical protein
VGVSCSRCRKPLRPVDPAREGFVVYEGDHSSLPILYSGVICTRCGRIECTTCRLGGMSRPCYSCGGRVEPAYDYAIRRARAAPPSSRLMRNLGLLILLGLVGFGVQRAVFPKKEPAATGSAARLAEVRGMSDPEDLTAIVRDGEEQVDVRVAAIHKLDNDGLFEEIARDEQAPMPLREAAVNGLRDQSLLAALARDWDVNPDVREAVVKRLDDADLLRVIATDGSEYENIQQAARDRLRRLALK